MFNARTVTCSPRLRRLERVGGHAAPSAGQGGSGRSRELVPAAPALGR